MTINNSTNTNALFVNATVSGLSQINVAAGILGFDRATGNQGGGTAVNVSNGAALYLYNGQFGNFVNNLTLNGGTGVGGGGALQNNGGGNATETGTVLLNSGNSSISTVNANLTLSGVVSGTGAVTKIGNNTLTLTNTNTYTGSTTVSGGTLQLGTGRPARMAPSPTPAASPTTRPWPSTSSAARRVGYAIGGTGTLTKSGAGTLTITPATTYTGATAVNGGTLALQGKYGFQRVHHQLRRDPGTERRQRAIY